MKEAIETKPLDPLDELQAEQRKNCPACQAQRCHTKEEDRAHHPLNGHGYTPETGHTYNRKFLLLTLSPYHVLNKPKKKKS